MARQAPKVFLPEVCVSRTSEEAIIAQQAQALSTRGLTAKNTFIDEPARWFGGLQNIHQRSKSLPPKLREVPLVLEEAEEGLEARCEDKVSACPRPSSPSNSSQASTYCLTGTMDLDEVDCTISRSITSGSSTPRTSSSADTLRELAQVIETECGFLRLNGYTMSKKPSGRAQRQGLSAILRFYVRGLPWAKRAKWQQPLLWSVAAVLQGHNVNAKVQSGNLVVTLDDGAAVRVDFAAGRL